MELVLTERSTIRRIIRRRRRLALDRKDEVWNGKYIVMPDPDNEHQRIATMLATILQIIVRMTDQGDVYAGCNVTDRVDDWTKNYRVPDVAVYLKGNPAEDRQTHFLGGPDLAIEVVSDGDRSRRKRAFYASVGTRELLIVDRDPWQIELFRLQAGELISVGTATAAEDKLLISEVIPLRFRLIAATPRPQLEVLHSDGIQRWVC
ncbi:MAG: Uma2 family endonuclease [Planctomycetales bacterium]|nr:Uma2 family endonuclease [Planctomycetales bacterium]